MTQTNIRFSTNILKRLGEELNPDLTQGLIELVKNAYDADACQCIIEFHHIFATSQDNQSSLFRSKITIIVNLLNNSLTAFEKRRLNNALF